MVYRNLIFTFIPLVGGTAVSNINGDERISTALPIGFTFTVGCTDYTTFYASSNGYLSFGKSISTSFASVSGAETVLAPLWTHLSGAGTGAFSYQTSGAAPNRVFTAEWKNWKWAYNATGSVISFQVKIYEGTNSVEYIYNQEANDVFNAVTYPAAIGLYYNVGMSVVQTWLTDPATNPGTSGTLVRSITTRPASGQLYRFTINNRICEYYGQTIINKSGGMLADGSDGIRINLSGAGNMQIRRKWNASGVGKFQIYRYDKDLLTGTTSPYNVPGTTHGLVLSIGNTSYAGGTLYPVSLDQRLTVISSTEQSDIENGNNYIDVIKMAAVKNGLTYFLEVKYTYRYPDANFLIDYKVTIPEGNTEKVQLAHAWDTYLDGDDTGPGFVKGTAPNLIMGVTRPPAYEAFQYKGGVAWSGYYSAYYNNLNDNLGAAPWMRFKNTIDLGKVDNGIGISMDFGSTPGTFTSNNAVIFQCPTGDNSPKLSSSIAYICNGKSINLNSYIISTVPPAGTVLQWTDGRTGAVIADPANVRVEGVYFLRYYSENYECSSPTASLSVGIDYACVACYKPAVVTGTAEPIKTIISTLDRTAVPRNWSDPRAGSLILESKTRGLVLTRMAWPETTIKNPLAGMIVYDTANNVIKFYNGTVWKAMTQQGCPN
ncbi:hypothetical protein [Flavobacterium sp. HTF]|uniref:hypothetical protein n=1 Tax=Flavobacterium sp. HTF TaxID=2170732 RepID=UPI000D5EC9A5|nr:hypothetical protein [Flavobacterium sp. HTF]PWB25910.1 hypothetical protein DCO46_07640 [Flavobacterium sp. HTF]